MKVDPHAERIWLAPLPERAESGFRIPAAAPEPGEVPGGSTSRAIRGRPSTEDLQHFPSEGPKRTSPIRGL